MSIGPIAENSVEALNNQDITATKQLIDKLVEIDDALYACIIDDRTKAMIAEYSPNDGYLCDPTDKTTFELISTQLFMYVRVPIEQQGTKIGKPGCSR